MSHFEIVFIRNLLDTSQSFLVLTLPVEYVSFFEVEHLFVIFYDFQSLFKVLLLDECSESRAQCPLLVSVNLEVK